MNPLNTGNKVWISRLKSYGTVVSNPQNRSYVVTTPNGQIRRNRRHLTEVPENAQESLEEKLPESTTDVLSSPEPSTCKDTQENQSPTNTENLTTTRSGRVVRPPKRYSEKREKEKAQLETLTLFVLIVYYKK